MTFASGTSMSNCVRHGREEHLVEGGRIDGGDNVVESTGGVVDKSQHAVLDTSREEMLLHPGTVPADGDCGRYRIPVKIGEVIGKPWPCFTEFTKPA